MTVNKTDLQSFSIEAIISIIVIGICMMFPYKLIIIFMCLNCMISKAIRSTNTFVHYHIFFFSCVLSSAFNVHKIYTTNILVNDIYITDMIIIILALSLHLIQLFWQIFPIWSWMKTVHLNPISFYHNLFSKYDNLNCNENIWRYKSTIVLNHNHQIKRSLKSIYWWGA